MIADTEIGISADNEELSIAEASLEFGLSEGTLRRTLNRGQIHPIAHRWEPRLRRKDVARFVSALSSAPVSASSVAAISAKHSRSVMQRRREQLEAAIGHQLGELGEASISEVHQRLIEADKLEASYSTVATAFARLAAQGKLVTRPKLRGYTYKLPGGSDTPPLSPTPPHTLATTRALAAPRRRAIAAPPGTVEQETLAALRRLGNANLDQIYQALSSRPQPAFVEIVRAVRSLVRRRLVVRFRQGNRYLFRVGE